jgi:ribosome biogenesis GTPase A
MPSEQIQWFPGHMAKTRRLISENLKNVDIVIELLDARIPLSSKNPEIARLTEQKPRLIILNKASLADSDTSRRWMKYFKEHFKFSSLLVDCISGEGIDKINSCLRQELSEKLERWSDKGMEGRRIKAMIVGIPNVGKSTLINRISGAKKAKAENRPGVTLQKQWVTTSIGVDLLDMPGVLWPKFEERRVGENLALTGAIKDDILDTEGLAITLCSRLRKICPDMLCSHYKLGDVDCIENLDDYDLFEFIGRKRGNLMSGGVVNTERTANMLLDEFRAAKIGRISLEEPKI